MNPEPRIETLKDLKDFLSDFDDLDLQKLEVNSIVWNGSISRTPLELKKKYIQELIADSK